MLSGLMFYIGNRVNVNYMTIPYEKGGGVLKVVCLDKQYQDLVPSGNAKLLSTNPSFNPPSIWHSIWQQLCNESEQYPFESVLNSIAVRSIGSEIGTDTSIVESFKLAGQHLFSIPKINDFVSGFYASVKKALPILMASRYHEQMFSLMNNGINGGKSIVDYTDPENSIIVKTLPIMDITRLKETFENSFGNGQFKIGKTFSYSHCIVDLNPSS